jgi:hypothetical protein
MTYTPSQLSALNADDGFQSIVSADVPLARAFEAPKRTIDDRITEMALALGGAAPIGASELPAPTAGVLMILGVVQSPLLTSEAATLLDVDIAARIFHDGRTALNGCANLDEIKALSAGYCDVLGVDRAEAWQLMQDMIWESFAGLERIPDTGTAGKTKCRFDLGWFASITSRVSTASGLDAEYIGWQMPLALATHYLVAHHQANGGTVYEPNRAKEAMDRLHYLMDQRIAEKGYK